MSKRKGRREKRREEGGAGKDVRIKVEKQRRRKQRKMSWRR